MKKIITISIMSLIIISCSKKEEQTDYTTFNCGETAVIIKPISSDEISLALDARVYDLKLEKSASGAKYETNKDNQKIVFWNKGNTALLEVNGNSYPECLKLETAKKGIITSLKATGNEPSWSISLDTDTIKTSGAIDGTYKIHNTLESEDVINYDAKDPKTGAHINVSISYNQCEDTMSGNLFPYTVIIINYKNKNKILYGCGRS